MTFRHCSPARRRSSVGIIAGIPVWRQLRDSNLQTRISHRETLATLLRDALRRYEKVEEIDP